MLHIRLSSTLLLAATCLLSGADASTEKAVTCDSGVVQRLSCENGVISVAAALYGRADGETCSEGRPQQQLANTECSQQGTVDVLRRRCDGKKVCELSVTDVQSPNPCLDTYKYLETSYTCLSASYLVTCEHSFAHLHCDEGYVILVYGAHYGRHDQTTCSYRRPASQLQNVDCSGPTSKVAESCNGKNSCTIRASNSVFGDPCYGTYKYLEVAYVCQAGSSKTCPPGWTWFGGRCFIFKSSEQNWTDAESSCNTLGGHLASFHSTAEYIFIRELILTAAGSYKRAWVGGNDIQTETVWKWSDGSQFDFINWASGQPDNYGGGEDCMEINYRGGDYVNDVECKSQRPFVCVRAP